MNHWLYPANTKFYDVLGAFGKEDAYWPANASISVGDIVYIYLAAPHKQVGFVCRAMETGLDQEMVLPRVLPFFKKTMPRRRKPKAFMNLRILKTIALADESPLSFQHLKKNGLTGMLMGPRKLENNPKLLKYIKKVCNEL